MTPDRRSRRAVALPAGPVPTADQSPSQGNKGIISPNRHDSSNCLPVSTHPDVRRVFNEPPKKKTPRSSSRNPGQIRFRGFRPHFSAADRTAFVRLFTLARGHARSSSILFNPPIFRGGTRKFQPISARDLFRFPSLDGCEPRFGSRFGTRPPAIDSDRAVSEGFGASSEASMRSGSGAQLRTQRRTRTRPSPTFPLGTSVDRRTRVSHPRNAR